MATIREESSSMWEKRKWKRNVVMRKMVAVNSRKYNVQFVMKAMTLTIAVCSRIKHLRREAKYYGRKSCAMDNIHQYHKITMQKHINFEEHARSVSSLIQQFYKNIYQRRSNLR